MYVHSFSFFLSDVFNVVMQLKILNILHRRTVEIIPSTSPAVAIRNVAAIRTMSTQRVRLTMVVVPGAL